MERLEAACALARAAHEGQRDKGGAPYIRHPLFVMSQMDTEAERIAAVLHDILEDTETTAADLLRAGMPAEAVEAVELLTHDPAEDYFSYVRRAARNPIARKVKMADLRHNLDAARIPYPSEKDAARMKKYAAALQVLMESEPEESVAQALKEDHH